MRAEDFIQFQKLKYVNKLLASEQEQDTKTYFASIADHIFNAFQPTTLLDVGCHNGELVAALRRMGIKAWGVDFTEDGILQASEDAAPYCRVISATEPFSQTVDLIVCLEGLVNLSPEEAEQVILNFQNTGETILFSSTPVFHEGINPSIIRPPSYWSALFASIGFYHDLDYSPHLLAPWAMLFRKGTPSLQDLTAAYESRLWRSHWENRARRSAGIDLHHELTTKALLIRLVIDQAKGLAEDKVLLQAKLEAFQSKNQILLSDLQTSRSDKQAMETEIKKTQDQLKVVQEDKNALEKAFRKTEDQLKVAQEDKDTLYAELVGLYNSRSWRLIQFLQKIKGYLLFWRAEGKDG